MDKVSGPVPLEEDPDGILPGAVLLSDRIEHYAMKYGMIEDYDDKCLEPASYNLRLGVDYRVNGKTRHLSGQDQYLVIEPYQVVVLSTLEHLCLPRFIIGRWSLRVTLAYEGLLWTGGAQVDPGYCGRLYCPIYNLSDREIQLRYQQKLFSIDFVSTTPFDRKKCRTWSTKKKDDIENYDKHGLRSELVDTSKKAKDAVSRIDSMSTLVLAILAVIVTALAVLVTTSQATPPETLPLALSGSALIVSLLVLVGSRASGLKFYLWVLKRWQSERRGDQ